MGVSKNSGTPKWMVNIMENPIKMDDLGVPIFLETPKYTQFTGSYGIAPFEIKLEPSSPEMILTLPLRCQKNHSGYQVLQVVTSFGASIVSDFFRLKCPPFEESFQVTTFFRSWNTVDIHFSKWH